MAKQNNGEKQIDSARKALKAALSELPDDVRTGLRTYAHKVPQSDKANSCKDTELLVSIDSNNHDKIISSADKLETKGFTPIAYSLEQSKNDFDLTKESEKTIILLSDGEETCDGNPTETMKKLLAEGFKVKVHTIGFMVDQKTAQQLKSISDVTGGTYYDAKSSSQLSDAFKEATKKVKIAEAKENKYGGKTVTGGAVFEEAVPLEKDIEYKLEHALKKNQYQYFTLDLKAGQEVTVEIRTYEKGITISENGKITENNNPYAGIKLIQPDKTNEKKATIIGAPFHVETIKALPATDGKYYLLVGSEYEAINPEHTTFKYTVVSKGDLDTELDAGSSIDTALKADFKRYTKNYLKGGDVSDIFAIDVVAGESFIVGYAPNTTTNYATVNLQVTDDFKDVIASKSFDNGKGGKTDPITPSAPGKYFVEVISKSLNEETLEYTIEFRKVSVAQPVATVDITKEGQP